jgi:hypothetical protein
LRQGELALSDAVDLYFKVNDARLRDGTVAAYRTGVDALIDFANGRLLTKSEIERLERGGAG